MTRLLRQTTARARRIATALAVVCTVVAAVPLSGRSHANDRAGTMAKVPAGSYEPLYKEPSRDGRKPAATNTAQASTRRRVGAFEIDVYPVTNGEFLAFVREHPEWRRSQAKKLFADSSYLSHWKGDLDLGLLAPPDSPVVNVSWFAARAYLRTQGKDLPTVDQWEYAGAASEQARDASRDPAFIDRLRVWYGQSVPQRLPAVSTGFRNTYGIRGMHGLVWEWTLDFNSALVTGESRADSAIERSLYCGSGASGAADFENYPAFMRYALRGSLGARYALGSLGFRGVRNLPGGTK